tara:strand:+ start:6018 stop:6431 length:414 start_codon:yes stop_codon:yes gene_type:complete
MNIADVVQKVQSDLGEVARSYRRRDVRYELHVSADDQLGQFGKVRLQGNVYGIRDEGEGRWAAGGAHEYKGRDLIAETRNQTRALLKAEGYNVCDAYLGHGTFAFTWYLTVTDLEQVDEEMRAIHEIFESSKLKKTA